jgi:hypothetical protein
MIIFYFLKIIFEISTSKRSKNIKKINFLIFLKIQVGSHFQTTSKSLNQPVKLSSSQRAPDVQDIYITNLISIKLKSYNLSN